jgi:DnaK suppressor protein
MAASAKKTTVVKKEKQSASKVNTVKPPSGKGTAKPSGKNEKPVIAEKQEKKILPAKKAVAEKSVARKPVAKKIGNEKKALEKTGTTKDRLADLRKSLLRKKESILKEAKEEIAKYISGENKQIVDTANDDGDWAQVDISEDLSLQRLSAHRKLMHNIDEALRKISEGTYGTCEDCGEEISEKRLMVLPTATLCVDCQANKEQIEAFGNEE